MMVPPLAPQLVSGLAVYASADILASTKYQVNRKQEAISGCDLSWAKTIDELKLV